MLKSIPDAGRSEAANDLDNDAESDTSEALSANAPDRAQDASGDDPFDQDFSSSYKPQHFHVIHMRVGAEVEALLTQRDNLVRMATASDLSRPAAQIMAGRLKAAFPSWAKDHQFRQFIGHRIRHIMALLGYELDQPNVRIPNGVLFTCAARYRKRADGDNGES